MYFTVADIKSFSVRIRLTGSIYKRNDLLVENPPVSTNPPILVLELNIGEGEQEMGRQRCYVLSHSVDSVHQAKPLLYPELG